LIIVSAVALISGGLLALRFSIFALPPGIVIADVMSVLIVVAHGGAIADGLWMALHVAVALQLGFLAGAILEGVAIQRPISPKHGPGRAAHRSKSAPQSERPTD
jgi:hypothetical protein